MSAAKFQPKGYEFLDGTLGLMLLVEDELSGYHHWLCRKHPDGQWVTFRKATADDLGAINRVRRPLTRVELVACPHCGAVQEARITAFEKLDGTPPDFYAQPCGTCGELVNETEWKRDAAPAAAAGA